MRNQLPTFIQGQKPTSAKPDTMSAMGPKPEELKVSITSPLLGG